MAASALAFALIISGEDAPAPAPRVPAVDAECTGLYHRPSGRIVRPDYAAFRAALPPRLRRYIARDAFPSLWFDKRAEYDGGRTRGGALPFYSIRNASGALIATVYAALCEEAA